MIYFVRHGQTYDNANKILQGDGPLNELGVSQAKNAGILLKDIKFDICFCSPMLRTRQTLDQIIVYHENLKVIYDERLIERKYGDVVGRKYDTVVNLDKRWYASTKYENNIETIDEIYDRVASFYDDIKEEYKDKTVLIVSHSGVGRVTNAYFNGKPNNGDYTGFKVKNAEVVKFDWRETCEK